MVGENPITTPDAKPTPSNTIRYPYTSIFSANKKYNAHKIPAIVTSKNSMGSHVSAAEKSQPAVCSGTTKIFSNHGCPVRITEYPASTSNGMDAISVFR